MPLNYSKRTGPRTWTLVREYADWEFDGEQHKVDDMLDMKRGSGDPEVLNAELKEHKNYWFRPWMTADRVMSKIEAMQDEKPQTRIENMAHRAKEIGEFIRHLQALEYNVERQYMTKDEVIVKLWRVIRWCNTLMQNNRRRERTGHSWSGIAAIKNNALSILENLGCQVSLKSFATYKDPNTGRIIIVDHEYGDERARQEREGNDWLTEITFYFYGCDL